MIKNIKLACTMFYYIFSWFAILWMLVHLIGIRVYGGVYIYEANMAILYLEILTISIVAVVGGSYTCRRIVAVR